MSRVLVSVEGQTEEALAVQVLQPHLARFGVWLQPVIVSTKQFANGFKFKGGLAKWDKAARDIRRLLADTDAKLITTMYDFYALPDDTPGMDDRDLYAAGEDRVQHVERAIQTHFSDRRFLPYLSLHELEALVLAAPIDVLETAATASATADVGPLVGLGDPELVNENDPPSKRILECWPEYAKPIDGPAIIARVGLSNIRARCPHFDTWLTTLEAAGSL